MNAPTSRHLSDIRNEFERGVHEDYARLVDGTILRANYPGRLLFPRNFSL